MGFTWKDDLNRRDAVKAMGGTAAAALLALREMTGAGATGKGQEKVTICRNGKTKRVAKPALEAQLKNGATLGACKDGPPVGGGNPCEGNGDCAETCTCNGGTCEPTGGTDPDTCQSACDTSEECRQRFGSGSTCCGGACMRCGGRKRAIIERASGTCRCVKVTKRGVRKGRVARSQPVCNG